ncbi:MAG: hypothetical protein WAU32_16270, partial [Thermoanaerobaculia bacterium]
MEILSYPVGLLIGLFPIAADLGPGREPAHLLLDSRPVCELTDRAPGCMVDLGLDPRVHLLELVRTNAAGRVTERVRRWVTHPGIEPEVLAAGTCDQKRRQCDFDLSWAHPAKLDPKRMDLSLDGIAVWHGKEHHASVPLAHGAKPQVLVLDAQFPDGTRASYTRTLYAFYPEVAQAALQAVPIFPTSVAATDDEVAGALRDARLPVRTVESGESEFVFVLEPNVFDLVPGFIQKPPAFTGRRPYPLAIGPPTGGSDAIDSIRVVVPDLSLSAYETTAEQLGKRLPLRMSSWSRYSDAVTAAGYALGGSPRRRAIVLVLRGFERPDISTFSETQARAYLSEVMVPLYVWRIGGVTASTWPEGRRITSMKDLREAFEALRADVDRQRIVWLEGAHDTRYIGRHLSPSVAIAGRDAAPAQTEMEDPASAPPALASRGPDGGDVHALAGSADGSVLYAGTHAGVFRSRDRGAAWEGAGSGLPPVPVRCLSVDPSDSGLVYAGTDAGLFVTTDSGIRWRAAGGLASPPITALALDAARPAVLYAGTRGRGVLWSSDGGATLFMGALDNGDVRALLVDPRNRWVWAATEDGVFLSQDRGFHWTAAGKLPGRPLALAIDPRAPNRIYAGTAGDGLFVSADAGASWRPTKLSGAFLSDLRAVPGPPAALLAASPEGVFSSTDGGATWKLAKIGAVESIVTAGPGVVVAGGPRGALRADGAGRR